MFRHWLELVHRLFFWGLSSLTAWLGRISSNLEQVMIVLKKLGRTWQYRSKIWSRCGTKPDREARRRRANFHLRPVFSLLLLVHSAATASLLPFLQNDFDFGCWSWCRYCGFSGTLTRHTALRCFSSVRLRLTDAPRAAPASSPSAGIGRGSIAWARLFTKGMFGVPPYMSAVF